MNVRAPFLMRSFSPCSYISQVDLSDMQSAFIAAFQRWGMPDSIRVDNGQPLGDPRGRTIPPLALWLISIGVGVIWNRPYRPTDNAQVERMQGTTARWAEVKQASSLEQLQQRLKQALALQRERYRVRRLGQRTRLEVFPQLNCPRRTYLQDGFEPLRAYRFLAQMVLVRKVSSDGRVGLYGHNYQLGMPWARQDIQISLEADSCQWIFKDDKGRTIKSIPAKRFTSDDIWSLTVCERT